MLNSNLKGKKKKRNSDSFRNRFIRWFGGVPIDDFNKFTDDMFKVLGSFEQFSKSTSVFCSIVSDRLGFRFENGAIIDDKVKTSEDVEREYVERGMV